MIKNAIYLVAVMVHHSLIERSDAVIYTYEDVELRRIFPSEFPQDTVRKTGNVDAEHLGRYTELRDYFLFPKSKINSHFEEMKCYDTSNPGKRLCQVDLNRYSSAENTYFMSKELNIHTDPRRVYCVFFLCFTADELDKVVRSF